MTQQRLLELSMKNTKEYIVIEKDILLQQMSIAEKTVKKHGIIVKDSNPFLKQLLIKKGFYNEAK